MKKKTKPSTAQINASIRKANAAYKKATPAGRRVLIAQDVIAQVKADKYVPVIGEWANFTDLTCKIPEEESVQLQGLLHNPKAPSCHVCGIGSLFLSAVRCRNDYSVTCDDTDEDEALTELREFTPEQRKLIEMAYERGVGFHSETNDRAAHTDIEKTAVSWSDNWLGNMERDDNAKRMTLIMENIVRNNGRFIPAER